MDLENPKAREKMEMREKILHTASQLFVERGFEKTTIRAIAEEIGYSPRTIYLYFKDKDDLFYQMSLDAFKLFVQYFQEVPTDGDPLDRLCKLGQKYLSFASEHPGYYDLMFILRSPMNHDENDETFEIGMKSKGILKAIVSDCQKAGYLQGYEIEHLALMIWAEVHGLVSLHIRERLKMYPDMDSVPRIEQAHEIFVDMLRKF